MCPHIYETELSALAIIDAKLTRRPAPPPFFIPDSHNTKHSSCISNKSSQNSRRQSTNLPLHLLSLSALVWFKKPSKQVQGREGWEKKKMGLSTFFDEQKLYKIWWDGILNRSISLTCRLFVTDFYCWKYYRTNGDQTPCILSGVSEGERDLSCCRSLSYLLGEARFWFRLTHSAYSSALLGVNYHRANTNSLRNKFLQTPKIVILPFYFLAPGLLIQVFRTLLKPSL